MSLVLLANSLSIALGVLAFLFAVFALPVTRWPMALRNMRLSRV